MRKYIIALFVATLPTILQAQSVGLFGRKAPQNSKSDLAIYTVKGAISETEGKVVFKDIILAPGKTKADIFAKLAQWSSFRFDANATMGEYQDTNFFKNLEVARVLNADKQTGKIDCQGAEELIFSIKPLAKNYTQIFYLLHLTAFDGKVEFEANTISFNVDQGGGVFTRVSAEDWITDTECLNKRGELRRIPGKFRVKTIDLMAELKNEITNTINQ